MRCSRLTLLFFLLAIPATCFSWSAKVVSFADSDTIIVLNNDQQEEASSMGLMMQKKKVWFTVIGKVLTIGALTPSRYFIPS